MPDVDGDGFAELAVGASQRDAVAPVGGEIPGYVELVSSNGGGVLWTSMGGKGDRCFGAALARIGDVDRDGLDDLLVGIPGPAGLADAAGRIVALSSATGSQLYVVACEEVLVGLGSSLAAAGDLDGDGCADAIAAGTCSRRAQPGLDVLLVSGASGETRRITTLATEFLPPQGGFALTTGRDDSRRDLIAVGLPFEDAPQMLTDAGAVELIRPTGESVARFVPRLSECESPDRSFVCPPLLGTSLTLIEDPDGAPCCIVGAPGFFRWGFVAFVDGLDWDGRQLIQEPEKLTVPLTLVR